MSFRKLYIALFGLIFVIILGSIGGVILLSKQQENVVGTSTKDETEQTIIPDETTALNQETPKTSTTAASQPSTTEVLPITPLLSSTMPTLESYRNFLESIISKDWQQTNVTVRKSQPSVSDVNVSDGLNHVSQISVPTTLTKWEKFDVNPWEYGARELNFTQSIAETKNYFGIGTQVSIKIYDGVYVPRDNSVTKDDSVWQKIHCPENTPEDISVVANAFANFYPGLQDEEVCASIVSAKLHSAVFGELTRYTLNQTFAPFDRERAGVIEVDRPTIIIRKTDRANMIMSFRGGQFGLIEITYVALKQEKLAELKMIGDEIISLFPELKTDNLCIYEACY